MINPPPPFSSKPRPSLAQLRKRRSRLLVPLLLSLPLLVIVLFRRAKPSVARVEQLSEIPILPGEHVQEVPAPNRTTVTKSATASSPSATAWPAGRGHAPMTAAEMSADYLMRVGSAEKAGRRPPIARYIRWLHAPKTGTSFMNTILRWGCEGLSSDFFAAPRLARPANLEFPYQPELAWDWLYRTSRGRTWLRRQCGRRLVRRDRRDNSLQYSVDMHRELRSAEAPVAAALFRSPAQRTLSNYQHIAFHYNASRSASQTLERFLSKPQFQSQQAKVLLGVKYKAKVRVSRAQARKAVRKVRELLFVGLTDEFDLSVRLFHARFGGVPHRAQFANVRPGLSRVGEKTANMLADGRYDESVLNGWRDEADEMVYAAAEQRFWEDVREWRKAIEEDGIGAVVVGEDEPRR